MRRLARWSGDRADRLGCSCAPCSPPCRVPPARAARPRARWRCTRATGTRPAAADHGRCGRTHRLSRRRPDRSASPWNTAPCFDGHARSRCRRPRPTAGARPSAGYHRLEFAAAVQPRRGPAARCTIEDAGQGRKLWGLAVQLYAPPPPRRWRHRRFCGAARFAAASGAAGRGCASPSARSTRNSPPTRHISALTPLPAAPR